MRLDCALFSSMVAAILRVRGTMKDFGSPPRELDVRVMDFPAGRAESDQGVFFESFNRGNFEIGVKMVDGCGLPAGDPLRAYWLFVGGLTNARAEIRIEDTVTGEERELEVGGLFVAIGHTPNTAFLGDQVVRPPHPEAEVVRHHQGPVRVDVPR